MVVVKIMLRTESRIESLQTHRSHSLLAPAEIASLLPILLLE